MNYNAIKQEIKQQYKNREHSCNGKKLTIKDWETINQNFRKSLKQMNVKNKGVFYNPNNDRVYIKQTFRTIKIDGLNFIQNSSEDYFTATGQDYYTDEEYFSVPAW